MPQRKARLYRTGYHRRRESPEVRHWLDLNDLGHGKSYGELIKNAWDTIDPSDESLKFDDRFVKPMECNSYDNGTLVFEARVGYVGEPGPIVDAKSDKTVLEDKDGNMAKLGPLRIAYTQIDNIDGFYFVENTNNGNLYQAIQKIVRNAFKEHDENLTVTFENVVSGRDWSCYKAMLEELRIVVAQPSEKLDELGNVGETRYRVEYSIKPKKGQKFFERKIKEALFGQKVKPEELLQLNLPDEVGPEDIIYKVKLGDGTRSKLMTLETPSGIPSYEILSLAGEPAISNEEFANLAHQRAQEYIDNRDGGTED